MSLSSLTANRFETHVRSRGEVLFAQHRVYQGASGSDYFFCRVQGGDLYDVRIRVVDGGLEVWCDCRYFADAGPCKHLWATILHADRRGALTTVERVGFLNVERDADERAESYLLAPASRPFLVQQRVAPWQEYLGDVERSIRTHTASRKENARPMEILYAIDVASSRAQRKIVVEVLARTRRRNGDWSEEKPWTATADHLGELSDPVDIEAVSALVGGQDVVYFGGHSYPSSRKVLVGPQALKLLPLLASAQRLYYREVGIGKLIRAGWDAGEPWMPWLEVRQDDRDQWTITGQLRRGEERMELTEPGLMLEGGLMLTREHVARFEPSHFAWVEQLRQVQRIPFPDRERDAVLAKLLELPVPPMELDEALRFEERAAPPRLGLRIRHERAGEAGARYAAQFMVDYGSGWMDGMSDGRGVWQPRERVYLRRDQLAETGARMKLSELGVRTDPYRRDFYLLAARSLPKVVRTLIAEGWRVEADGKLFRTPGATKVAVKSGIDWFELHGEVDYGGTTVKLPDLLAAVRRGDSLVVLGDGSFGLLPEEWLERFAPLAGLGESGKEHLTFRRNQAALLDALLAAQPEVDFDATFARLRERIRTFQGIEACAQPEGFVGQLRQYQLEGLGWMQFLREFGFGGCLADDMGVGKTAQVLAALETRRAEGKGPSLVVVPRSVMFNWREESNRFTPRLRVLEHHGMARDISQIAHHDLVLTTYGTMRRDAEELSKIEFDYVVLDEAQAVKNASTASAKAARLLRGSHRLALSGTPVENHLGELWSLFEFLNPGMLGEARVLQMAGGLARNPSEEARRLLAQALRPFILRRTKQQVARELPEKTEQTVFCELEGPQKKQYEELREHYRASLLERVRTQGLNRSKMHVLEALLRLRQAACHPGLLDAKRVDEPSAKLETLLEQLTQVCEEGHKALVFSQFTSLLSIVRRRLDHDGVRYEYLDGATNNRQERVETFQNDPACRLFLISLKAGGLGLNLTAAEYVFLLDPWWNPAVEAQAVDRAHRIGQTKPVFAYRLIARDTVEEKVLQLQKTKRDLADAILSEDNSVIRDLNSEDLELLLS